MAERGRIPRRRFPDRSDFVGRYVRELFAFLIDELNDGIRQHYPAVTPAQGRIMTLLDREGVRMTALAARAQLTKQSLTELVVGLEQAGLVERRSDPADGRAKLVVPTEEGERAMQLGLEVALAIHRRWTGLVGRREMESLMQHLGTLVAALRAEQVVDSADPG